MTNLCAQNAVHVLVLFGLEELNCPSQNLNLYSNTSGMNWNTTCDGHISTNFCAYLCISSIVIRIMYCDVVFFSHDKPLWVFMHYYYYDKDSWLQVEAWLWYHSGAGFHLKICLFMATLCPLKIKGCPLSSYLWTQSLLPF